MSVRFQVWAGGQRLEARLLARLDRVRLRDTDRDPSLLILAFSLDQDPDGGFALLDDPPLQPGAPLALDLGVRDAPLRRVFEGQVTHVRPHFEPVEASCTVEIVAQDGALALDLEERIQSWADQTDAEIATAIFGRYSYGTQVSDTPTRWAEDHQVQIQRGSDLAFLRGLAQRNGYVCYVAPDGQGGQVGVFGPPDLDGRPQPDLCALGEGANLRWLDLQWAGDRAATVQATGMDPLGRRLVRATGAARSAPLGGRAATALAASGFENATLQALIRDQHPWQTLERAAAVQAQALAVEAQGELDPETYGDLLQARRPALLKGVGRRYAGRWYIHTVETTLQAGAITQRFSAGRDGLMLAGDESFGQEAT